MANDNEIKTGLYERAVQKVTDWAKPNLHKVTEDFTEKSVEKYAKDNPKLARMIEFEVKRRGDGAGLTQDVAEPLIWTGVKTVAAAATAVVTESYKHGEFKLIGRAAVLGILINNAVDLFRLVPRYRAGLQGSLEMAKDRWRSLEQTGIDPFVNRESREIAQLKPAEKETSEKETASWAQTVKTSENAPSAPSR